MPEITGQCLCGAVSFGVGAVNTEYHACHCSMCRRWAGGPLFASAVENVRFQGQENITEYSSSEWAARGFCRTCGSNIYYRLKETDYLMICVGTFDDPKLFSLVGEIFIDHKPAGYDFAGDHPRLTEAEALAEFTSS